MKAPHCCCCCGLRGLLGPAFLLLLLLLQAAQAAPGPGPPEPRPRTTPPGSTAAPQPGPGAPEAARPRDPEGGNGSSAEVAGQAGAVSVGGGLAVSPSPGDKPMTQRALTVLMVVSGAVLVYFVVRTVRMRRKNRKTRRYGVLDTNIENMELTPLEQDDEDEDNTLFDANHPRR